MKLRGVSLVLALAAGCSVTRLDLGGDGPVVGGGGGALGAAGQGGSALGQSGAGASGRAGGENAGGNAPGLGGASGRAGMAGAGGADAGGTANGGASENVAGALNAGGSAGAAGVIGNVRELIVGPRATCVRQVSGRVRCWGSAEDGALPLETDPTHPCGDLPCVQIPTTVPDLWDARGVALGALHGCSIDDSGMDDSGGVKCWGSNDFGELGRGVSDADAHPEPLAVTLTSVRMLRAGDHHTCALQTNGRVYCWGLGASGQLGVAANTLETCAVPPTLKGVGVVPATDEVACSTTPLEVTGLTNVTSLFAQGANTCARTSGGAFYCWGSNDARQLAPGSGAATVTSPVELKNAAGLAFALGAHHACTRDSEGAVRCWGAHDAGQLGVGSASVDDCGGRACRGTPTLLADLPKAKLLALGGEHSCATLESGSVRCWGSDAVGQLGDSSQVNLTCSALGGSVPCQTRPLTTVHELTGVHALACGSRHCCAQSGAEVMCWGSNAWGQSSGFDLAPRPFPSKVYGLD